MNYRQILTGLLLVVCLSVKGQIPSTGSGQASSVEPQTNREKAEACFLQGLCEELKGNHAAAFELYRHVLELHPEHVGALSELSNYWLYLHNDSMAVATMEQAAALDADNYWLKQSLVQLYMRTNRNDDAISTLEAMAKRYPRKSEVLMMLMEMYTKRQDYEQVVKTLDRIELLEGKSEQLSMQKVRIYSAMKDEKRALAEMRMLADEYPNDIRYRVLVGDYYLDNDQPAEAFKIYSQLEKEEPDNVNVLLSLANYYSAQKEDSLCQETLLRLTTNENLDSDTRLRIMQGIVYEHLQEKTDTAQVMSLLRRQLSYPQTDGRLAELSARYMISVQAPREQVKPVLHQVLSLDPETDAARQELLSYAIQENDTSGIVRLCKTAVDYGSSEPIYYYYLGIALFQQNQRSAALKAIQKGIAKMDDKSNLQLLTNMYAISGDLFHSAGNDDRAFLSYDSCLLYRPDDALVLNNYAYYLSLRKQDLQRAEEMSKKALQKEGSNPTYLDTYAWVLFQQKRYKEAKVVIDSVMTLLGNDIKADDASLVEHAGDIYSKCGEKAKAMEFWQKAKALKADVSATIDEKIKKGKYKEEKLPVYRRPE